MKPGALSTEHLASVVGESSLLYLAFSSGDFRLQLGALIGYVAIVGMYVWARTRVKSRSPHDA